MGVSRWIAGQELRSLCPTIHRSCWFSIHRSRNTSNYRSWKLVCKKDAVPRADDVRALAACHVVERGGIGVDAITRRNPAQRVGKALHFQEAFVDQALQDPFGVHLGNAGLPGEDVVAGTGEALPVGAILRTPEDVVDGLLGPGEDVFGSEDAAYAGMGEDAGVAFGAPERRRWLRSYRLCWRRGYGRRWISSYRHC